MPPTACWERFSLRPQSKSAEPTPAQKRTSKNNIFWRNKPAQKLSLVDDVLSKHIVQIWGYLMTLFFLKWHWDLETGCSSFDKSPPIQDLMGLLQPRPPQYRDTDLAGAGLPSILTHQTNGTPRTPKDMAEASATWEANWEPGGCPDPSWVCGVWGGKVSQISAPPLPPLMSLVTSLSSPKAHWNSKFLSLRYRLKNENMKHLLL